MWAVTEMISCKADAMCKEGIPMMLIEMEVTNNRSSGGSGSGDDDDVGIPWDQSGPF